VRIFSPVVFCALLTACDRYADFTLPPPDAGGPQAPFRWEASSAPSIPRGAAGSWDSGDVLNPSVIRFHGGYLNLYSGYDGSVWHTGVAESSDGVTWRKTGRVLSPERWEGPIAANGSALAEGPEVLYWYVGGEQPRVGFARSRDGGKTWTKEIQPVLPLGPFGSWDERAVADPYVIRRGEFFFLFYLGQDRARRQRLGVARSRDGVRWEKSRSNPLLELGASGAFDEAGLGEPAVWSSGGAYWMLYTGRARDEQRRLGLARSTDGMHWAREAGFAPAGGAEAWDSKVVCDPTVELTAEGVRVWFGGGDVPSPDQNLHGQIGLGVLH
jgi:predicted GH43/DUF377 family glycosyl hydrolase